MRECEQHAEYVLYHRGSAVVANIADCDASLTRSFEINVVGAGRSEGDQLQRFCTDDQVARQPQFVKQYDFAVRDTRGNLVLARGVVQHEPRRRRPQRPRVEIADTDGRIVEKYALQNINRITPSAMQAGFG